MRLERWFVALVYVGSAVVGQPAKSPVAAYPVVDISGRIERVELLSAQRMPAILVAAAKGTAHVQLGSMRYVMEQNFNPKAGERVEVTAYRIEGMLVAITVTLPDSKKTVRFRDANGWPMWRGMGHHGSHHAEGHPHDAHDV